jgi:translation initiation factor 3 subunit D
MTLGSRGGARGGMVGGWQERNRDGQTNAVKQYARDQRDAKDRARFGGGPRGGGRGGGRGFDSWRDRPQRIRVASVEIRPEWTPLDGNEGREDFTMSLTSMEKLSLKEEPVAEEVAAVGSTFISDKATDRASVRAPVTLRKLPEPKPFHLATTDDPVIRRLAAQGRANIFATDIALAVLMAAPRSVIPWDMVVQRVGDLLYLDVRDGCSLYDTTVRRGLSGTRTRRVGARRAGA